MLTFTSRTYINKNIEAALFNAHTVFNESVRIAMVQIVKLYNGTFMMADGSIPSPVVKDVCAKLAQIVVAVAKEADYTMNGFCLPNWGFGTAMKNAEKLFGLTVATTLQADYSLHKAQICQLINKSTVHPMPVISELAYENAAAKLGSYFAIHKESLRKRHRQRRRLKKFKLKNQDFMQNALPQLEKWQRDNDATIRDNRLRFDKFLSWLATDHQLVKWRNPQAILHPNSHNLICGPRKFKKKFFTLNPELAELDAKYKDYRRLSRLDNQPTLTLPHPTKHPAWLPLFRDKKMQRGIVLTNQKNYMEIRVPTAIGLTGWLPINLKVDRRLIKANITYQNMIHKTGKTSKDPVPVGYLDGLKINLTSVLLRYKRERPTNEPILVFLADYRAPSRKIDKTKPSLYVSADLGIRYPACCATAIMTNDKLKFNGFKVIKSLPHTRSLRNIDGLSRRISRSRSATGRPSANHGWKQQRHKTNAVLDRAKKTANAIITTAKEAIAAHPGCNNYIIIEDLKTLLPSMENNKFFNRKLATMLHGKISFYLESQAARLGIIVRKIMSNGTSRICGKCSHLGCRFTRKGGEVKSAFCGPWFWCPSCQTERNSDINAAINLIKIVANKTWKKHWAIYTSLDTKNKKAYKEHTNNLCLAAVRPQHVLVG